MHESFETALASLDARIAAAREAVDRALDDLKQLEADRAQVASYWAEVAPPAASPSLAVPDFPDVSPDIIARAEARITRST